jgi:hypothetical protein
VGQPLFLIECYSSSATAELATQMLAQLGSLAGDADGGPGLTPVSCIAIPADEVCLCLVESDSAESVHRALSSISIGHERIVGAVQVSPVRGDGLI